LTSVFRHLSIIKESSKKYGFGYVIKKAAWLWINLNYYKIFRNGKTFTFRGKNYPYVYHIYNNTWMNERSVEISLAFDLMKKYENKKILEIGNVTSNYFNIPHDVVDKYEKGHGVINEDVVNFQSSKKYDLVISISTLEHVGWDEKPRDDEKIPKALGNLRNLLKSDGVMMVTLPFGYNQVLNEHLNQGTIQFNEQYYLLRTEKNSWREASWDEVKETTFGNPYSGANGLIIGIDHGQ